MNYIITEIIKITVAVVVTLAVLFGLKKYGENHRPVEKPKAVLMWTSVNVVNIHVEVTRGVQRILRNRKYLYLDSAKAHAIDRDIRSMLIRLHGENKISSYSTSVVPPMHFTGWMILIKYMHNGMLYNLTADLETSVVS